MVEFRLTWLFDIFSIDSMAPFSVDSAGEECLLVVVKHLTVSQIARTSKYKKPDEVLQFFQKSFSVSDRQRRSYRTTEVALIRINLKGARKCKQNVEKGYGYLPMAAGCSEN